MEDNSDVFEACRRGDIAPVSVMIAAHPQTLAVKNEVDRTLLHFAVDNGSLEMCQLLLKVGTENAIQIDNQRFIDVLDGINLSSLCIAITKENVELVRSLALVFFTQGWTALHFAAVTECPIILQIILEIFSESAIDSRTPENWETALYRAVDANRFKQASLLIAAGANANITDRRNRVILIKAVKNNNLFMVQLLVSHGAHVYNAAEWSETAIHMAALKKDSKTVKYLLSQGTDPVIFNDHLARLLGCGVTFLKRDTVPFYQVALICA